MALAAVSLDFATYCVIALVQTSPAALTLVSKAPIFPAMPMTEVSTYINALFVYWPESLIAVVVLIPVSYTSLLTYLFYCATSLSFLSAAALAVATASVVSSPVVFIDLSTYPSVVVISVSVPSICLVISVACSY
jgi:hypothetical protein